jgi:hypothetical protein
MIAIMIAAATSALNLMRADEAAGLPDLAVCRRQERFPPT